MANARTRKVSAMAGLLTMFARVKAAYVALVSVAQDTVFPFFNDTMQYGYTFK